MKSLGSMTIKELKAFIRKQTEKANKRIEKIQKQKKPRAIVKKEIEYLKKQGIIGKRNKAVLGFSGKNKQQLVKQAQELRGFNQWKPSQPAGARKKEDISKYKKYMESTGEKISFSEWQDKTEAWGMIQHHFKSFKYEDFEELHERYNSISRKTILDVMKNVEGNYQSQNDYVDAVEQELKKIMSKEV